MIGKLIYYDKLFPKSGQKQAMDEKLLSLGFSLAKYVADLELDDEDLARLEEIKLVGKYPVDDRSDGDRILDRSTTRLFKADFDEAALDWACIVAGLGPDKMVHLVTSYGEEDITPEMAREHRDLMLKVMRADTFPGIHAMHGDTNYLHCHTILALENMVNAGKVDFGQGFPREALHVALAMIEAKDQLQCEPLRRFVADHTGVYHTWSGQKIADADGTLVDRSEVGRMWAKDRQFKAANYAPDGVEPGSPWPLDRGLKMLASGPLKQARNWQDVHAGLARVGIAYEPYRVKGKMKGGRLVAVGYGDGIYEERRRPASICGRAGDLSELMKRLGDQPYEEASPDIWIRPFVMPTYNHAEEKALSEREREAELAQEEEQLAADLRQAMQERHQAERAAIDQREHGRGRKGERGAVHARRNKAQQERAKRHSVERDLVDGLDVALRKERRKPGRGRQSAKRPIEAIIWGEPRDEEPERGSWRKRYIIDVLPEERRLPPSRAARSADEAEVGKAEDSGAPSSCGPVSPPFPASVAPSAIALSWRASATVSR